MKVFLSWSGDLSKELAQAIHSWLPGVLQSVRPFFTPNDIEKGARWNKDIAQELEDSSIGIFCLTRENLNKPWIMFEAGALSKQIDSSRVCPILFNVESTDIQGPLVQFQATQFNENDMRKLIKTINSALGDLKLEDHVINGVFDMWWPKLRTEVKSILERHTNNTKDTTSTRSDREILEEVLQLSRLSVSKRSFKSGLIEPAPIQLALSEIAALARNLVEQEGYNGLIHHIEQIVSPLEYIVRKLELNSSAQIAIHDQLHEIKAILEGQPF